MTRELPASIDEAANLLKAMGHIAGRDQAMVVFPALRMGLPVFLAGEAGIADKPKGHNADMHASAAYRAHLIYVMARRAVEGAK